MRSNPDFRRFVWANGVTQMGTQVTIVALPLAAVLALDAGALELGLLSAAQMVAFLLVGLPAGVWVDRVRRLPVLVWSDLVRGLALVTVPLAAWAGVLTLPQLYAVALILGFGTVFFDVAHMSLLPAVVPEDRLERGNSALEVTRNVSLLAGPGVGGWLVNLLTAPVALLADSVSYLASALLLSRVRAEERPPEAAERPSRHGLRREMAEGLAFVVREPVLRRVAVVGALVMAANSVCAVGFPLYLVKELKIGPGAYGLLLSASACGALAGAALVPRLTARFGTGATLYGSAALATVVYLPALATGPGWRLAFLPAAGALFGAASSVFGVTQLSHRQRVTPAHLLGRVNAAMRFVMWGAFPLGGLLGGALGERTGGYAVFAVGVAALGLSHLAVVTAPRIRTATAPPPRPRCADRDPA
ncbi:MFS transporter [Nonomuraea sp. SMC257]|uniref:MFS transporter n=1 Tax=Nonomuraea montanisoli TaxID=2741721 RepID=A0A7Y6M627_9ACTN|nr:MFS transporter [Nonomuraea montanisoli]NUW34894.1 MFS transporter [Nonomuraea montanisoli]